MKFKFEKHLEHQTIAVESIIRLFDCGRNHTKNVFTLQSISPVIKNELIVDEKTILENLKTIQEENKISVSSELEGLDFSVEMETGTGKTYVYLKTIFELNKVYGLKKFIILVPSVAIREGVFKTLKQTEEHFRMEYNTHHHYFAYDSKKLSKVRDFSHGNGIQIMVMTIQSFNSDNTVMRQNQDRFQGVPIELVSEARPIIIMDEPQNMETDLARSSINDLKPLFRLRYSATHKNKYNLVYSLSPVEAYEKRLVKKIEVYGVEESDSSRFIFEVKAFDGIKSTVGLEIKESNGEYVIKDTIIKGADDLFRKSKGNPKYEGLRVNQIDSRTLTIELSDGREFSLSEKTSENKEAIFRTQIRETIITHMDKQKKLGDEIKVLSLFFIDKVANYINNSLISQIFEEEFEKVQGKYEFFKEKNVKSVHNGYFSKKKEKGETIYKDTSGTTKEDKEVYDLIMKNKEQLLSFSEDTSFIFSHSALREGWDNPNVFQICTLNESNSAMKKRQEIGRGLRLCVNIHGERIYDSDINILTVIPNESYESFAGNLQREYEEEGYGKTPKPVNKRERVSIPFKKNFDAESIYFKELWEKIRKKTKYNINFNSEKLTENAVSKINEQLDINNLVVKIRRAVIDYDSETSSIKYIHDSESTGYALNQNIKIGNILDRMVDETGVTRGTIVKILSQIGNLDLIFSNPEEFTRSCIVLIKASLNEIIINEGVQYTPTNDIWELSIFEDLEGYISKVIETKKGPYEKVLFESDGEKEFAKNLEALPKVKVYTKLPPKFTIETPLGNYNPDWAIVIEERDGDKLYLVRETKFVDDLNNLRPSESQKIICGEKHFQSIGVNFKVSKKTDLSDLIK